MNTGNNNEQNKPNKVKLFNYECYHGEFYDKWCRRTYIAESAAKAKAQHYRYLQDGLWEDKFFDVVQNMKCYKIGVASIDTFYGDQESFDRMKISRDIPFAEIGMRVFVAGKEAIIVGSNGSMNLDVVFDGEWRVSNVHPHWEIIYHGKQNNVIANYCKQKVA